MTTPSQSATPDEYLAAENTRFDAWWKKQGMTSDSMRWAAWNAWLAARSESAATQTAKQQFEEFVRPEDATTPLERLRFFCSLAMRGQDWLDSEPFFSALEAVPSATGPSAHVVKTARCWVEDDKERGNSGWNPYIGSATEMAREILRLAGEQP